MAITPQELQQQLDRITKSMEDYPDFWSDVFITSFTQKDPKIPDPEFQGQASSFQPNHLLECLGSLKNTSLKKTAAELNLMEGLNATDKLRNKIINLQWQKPSTAAALHLAAQNMFTRDPDDSFNSKPKADYTRGSRASKGATGENFFASAAGSELRNVIIENITEIEKLAKYYEEKYRPRLRRTLEAELSQHDVFSNSILSVANRRDLLGKIILSDLQSAKVQYRNWLNNMFLDDPDINYLQIHAELMRLYSVIFAHRQNRVRGSTACEATDQFFKEMINALKTRAGKDDIVPKGKEKIYELLALSLSSQSDRAAYVECTKELEFYGTGGMYSLGNSSPLLSNVGIKYCITDGTSTVVKTLSAMQIVPFGAADDNIVPSLRVNNNVVFLLTGDLLRFEIKVGVKDGVVEDGGTPVAPSFEYLKQGRFSGLLAVTPNKLDSAVEFIFTVTDDTVTRGAELPQQIHKAMDRNFPIKFLQQPKLKRQADGGIVINPNEFVANSEPAILITFMDQNDSIATTKKDRDGNLVLYLNGEPDSKNHDLYMNFTRDNDSMALAILSINEKTLETTIKYIFDKEELLSDFMSQDQNKDNRLRVAEVKLQQHPDPVEKLREKEICESVMLLQKHVVKQVHEVKKNFDKRGILDLIKESIDFNNSVRQVANEFKKVAEEKTRDPKSSMDNCFEYALMNELLNTNVLEIMDRIKAGSKLLPEVKILKDNGEPEKSLMPLRKQFLEYAKADNEDPRFYMFAKQIDAYIGLLISQLKALKAVPVVESPRTLPSPPTSPAAPPPGTPPETPPSKSTRSLKGY